ncbi:MAG TPA: SPOR domain-containing protein [Gammaproteobacteria bacterium]|nr:SPOR domain-containing protein [Gammaproteobacteria bacterium]
MRYLVYLLLLANVAYFAWHQYAPAERPRVSAVTPLAPGIEPLVLLAERRDVQSQPAVTTGLEAPEEQRQPPVTDTEAGTEVVPVIEYNAPPVEESRAETVVQEPAAEPAPEPVHVCQTIGPLLDRNDAASISAQLYQQGYQPAVRGGEVREPAGYWVYMPAMPSAEARAIVSDLDRNGMKDYFIGKRNHISLGIFTSKRKARARLERIKSLGYDAVLDQRYRTRTVYWLDIVEKAQPLLGSDLWSTIQAEHPDIRVQRVSCE